jgi:hypothetical protein
VITVPHRTGARAASTPSQAHRAGATTTSREIGTSRPERGDGRSGAPRGVLLGAFRGRAGPPAPAADAGRTPAGAPRRGAGGGGRNRASCCAPATRTRKGGAAILGRAPAPPCPDGRSCRRGLASRL